MGVPNLEPSHLLLCNTRYVVMILVNALNSKLKTQSRFLFLKSLHITYICTGSIYSLVSVFYFQRSDIALVGSLLSLLFIPLCSERFLKKYFRFSYHLSLFTQLITILHFAARTGGLASYITIYLFIVPLNALYFGTTQQAKLWATLTLASMCVLFASSYFKWFSAPAFETHGYFYFHFTALLLTGAFLFVMAAFFKDSQERAYRELNKSQSKMIQQQKMGTIGELAGGVAHEINNPLAIIQGFTENVKLQLQKEHPDYIKVNHALNRVLETTQRIAKITESLLIFSNEDKYSEKHLHTAQRIVDDVLNFVGEKLKSKNIEIHLNIHPTIKVFTHRVKLEQVILSLINNSIDSISDQKHPWIEVSTQIKGEDIRIKVIDSGFGIEQDVVSKVMQPFFTTKGVGSTGLSLSVSKGVIESLDGELFYEPNEGNTCFVILLKSAINLRAVATKQAA